VLESAISNPSPLNLFIACFTFCTAPGLRLAPLFKSRAKSGKPVFSGHEASVSAALRRVLQGQEGKAFKLLCSNGVAAIDDEAFSVLQEMHPPLLSELQLPSVSGPQVMVDPKFVFDRLFNDAADFNISKDVFGWTPALFFSIRGISDGFVTTLAKFICLLTDRPGLFPDVCASMLTSGLLTPLHKLPLAEQLERQNLHLPPKIRPINSGTLITKVALAATLHTTEAISAASKTLPFQLALGTKRGVELLIHTCRAAYGKGHLIGRNDFSNGFNSMARQKMLDTHAEMFPEATSIFNFFYGTKSPVFLFSSEGDLLQLSSEQGSRQGCAAGSEAFCLTLHKVVFKLQHAYPEYEFRVVIDDIIPIVPPPTISSYSSWQACYTRYASFLRDLKTFSLELAGLSLNADKAGLLLPPGAPMPSTEVRALFDPDFQFRTDGFRVAGAPIGTNAYMSLFVHCKVVEANAKVAAIKKLGATDARAAHRLLIACATKLLNFLAATVPPSISLPLLLDFDNNVQNVFLGLLGFSSGSCSRERELGLC
jgi:hypothetical protein